MDPSTLQKKLDFLQDYSACDVSDALLKLQKAEPGQVARAGYLADLSPYIPSSPDSKSLKIIAPAYTIKCVSKNAPVGSYAEPKPANAIPSGTHWVDLTPPDRIVVMEQPPDQKCAVLGGIMAARLKVLGARAVIVGGRVRDLAELEVTGVPVWAQGKSTVGAGAEARILARDVPIDITGVTVSPGDIVFCDFQEGVVVIPYSLLDDVIGLMPKLVEADDRVKEDVNNGLSVFEAFKKHRSNL